MGWTAKTKEDPVPMAWDTVSDALNYRINWQMNKPATIELEMNDDSGANTQTYDNTYLGTSSIILEQPTNTEIFRGRIIAAEPNISAGILKLKGEDWLGQLDDRLVTFDTREILDPNLGNSMREYTLRPYLNDGSRCNALWEAAGNTNIDLSVADLGNWTDNDYNGLKIIFPYSYMGKQKDYCYAYDETVTEQAANGMDTDAPAAGEGNTWVDDANAHVMSNTEAAADPYFYVTYKMKTLAEESPCVDSITGMTLHCTVQFYGANIDVAWYGVNGSNMVQLAGSQIPMTSAETYTLKIPEFYVDGCIGATGEIEVIFAARATGNGTCSIAVNYVMVELDYECDTALATHAYTIDDTDVAAGVYNRLEPDGDTLETDGVCDYWRFHISDKITAYVIALVAAYDELHTLDTGDVVASTTYVGRHYHRVTPLAILRDLAQVDGTSFWLAPWDGDSLDLQWGTAFALNGEPTWTDSTVLQWTNPAQRLKDIINEWLVEGYTAGEYKAIGDDTDAGSITAHGRRTSFLNNPDIGSSHDAETLAGILVDRTKDAPWHVGAVLDGYSTVALGAVVTVDSTKLFGAGGGPNSDGTGDYVVTRKEYASQPGTTTFYLTPMQDALNMEKHLNDFANDFTGRIGQLEQRLERGRRYTDLWS